MMILVRNFAEFVTEEDLKARFLKYGEISSACIVLDKTIDEPRKLGFIDMPNEAEAAAALKALHRSKFQKEIIRVTKANPRFGPDYYLGNTKPEITTPTDKPVVPAAPVVRPAYESFAQKAKPDFKFGAKRRPHTDKRDAANSEFQRNTNRPEYPRGDRPYPAAQKAPDSYRGMNVKDGGVSRYKSPVPHCGTGSRKAGNGFHSSNKSADGRRTYGHFQKRGGARPYSAPQGERSFGYQGSRDRGGRPVQRAGASPEYKPGSERPYNRNSSTESARPYSAPRGERSYGYQGSNDRGARPHAPGSQRGGTRPYSAPQGERSRIYQGSKDRSARPASGFPKRDGARTEYKPQGKRPFGRSSSAEGSKPHGHFRKRDDGKSSPSQYGKRLHPR